MKIEIWSDFTCPFCYLGMRNLQAAMKKFPLQDAIKIEFKSFQLAPDAQYNNVSSMGQLLTDRYGLTSEKIELMVEDIVEHAHIVNLKIQLDNIKTSNTFLAHRLTKYAETQGREIVLMEELFKGHFNDALNLSDKHTLINLAEKSGLNREEADRVLSLNCHTKAVQEDEAVAVEIGINDVPFFIINEEHAIVGFRSESAFTNILEELWKSGSIGKRSKADKEGSYCTGTDCNR